MHIFAGQSVDGSILYFELLRLQVLAPSSSQVSGPSLAGIHFTSSQSSQWSVPRCHNCSRSKRCLSRALPYWLVGYGGASGLEQTVCGVEVWSQHRTGKQKNEPDISWTGPWPPTTWYEKLPVVLNRESTFVFLQRLEQKTIQKRDICFVPSE